MPFPLKRFGQHFLPDPAINRSIVASAGIVPGDVVLEIGPGTGSLTRELLAAGADVLAVEIDRRFADLLRKTLPGGRLEILCADALAGKRRLAPAMVEALSEAVRKSGKPGFKWVSNLPYNVATPLIVNILSLRSPRLLRAVVTVQWEVGKRLVARPGDPAYGPAGIQVQLRADVGILRRISAGAFRPRPKVDGAVVMLKPKDGIAPAEEEGFSAFIGSLFAHRRKTLKSSLALTPHGSSGPALLRSMGIAETLRPGCLSPAQLLDLYRRLRDSAGTSLCPDTADTR
ncbi:MAG: 16S rRNA (adenine(1518)-N(6)/adenine(1519)-N(6))-dimethyltransferase RsmA [Planctomycetota bacterium]|nr:16S rRNA (adenine(1518)-N(6)/adenine(1519)-N(6))-dimethyltransferase RsmA [Planctomycetota bacterium]